MFLFKKGKKLKPQQSIKLFACVFAIFSEIFCFDYATNDVVEKDPRLKRDAKTILPCTLLRRYFFIDVRLRPPRSDQTWGRAARAMGVWCAIGDKLIILMHTKHWRKFRQY